MAQVTEITRKYKRVPLSDDGQLKYNKKFRFKSPARMIIMGQSLMGKTYSLVNEPKFLIMDADKEVENYPECQNYTGVLQPMSEETFYTIENDIVIPGAIYELVMELREANQMDKFNYWKRKLEETEDLDEKKKIFGGLKKMLNKMPFPVIVGDSITSLQKLNIRASLFGYNNKVKPENRKTDIKNVDKWGGVNYIRPNFAGLLEFIETAAPFTLYNAHLKEKKSVLEKAPDEIVPFDIALEGIQSTTIVNRMSAVGVFYRTKEGCFIDFVKRAETDIGARPAHIANSVIKISEPQTTPGQQPIRYWKLIYPDLDI